VYGSLLVAGNTSSTKAMQAMAAATTKAAIRLRRCTESSSDDSLADPLGDLVGGNSLVTVGGNGSHQWPWA